MRRLPRNRPPFEAVWFVRIKYTASIVIWICARMNGGAILRADSSCCSDPRLFIIYIFLKTTPSRRYIYIYVSIVVLDVRVCTPTRFNRDADGYSRTCIRIPLRVLYGILWYAVVLSQWNSLENIKHGLSLHSPNNAILRYSTRGRKYSSVTRSLRNSSNSWVAESSFWFNEDISKHFWT